MMPKTRVIGRVPVPGRVAELQQAGNRQLLVRRGSGELLLLRET
jgi:hypothetical protein